MSFVKNYLKTLKPHIINAAVIFSLAFFFGIFAAFISPGFTESVFEDLAEFVGPIMEFSEFNLFVFVFFNNAFKVFASAIMGLFFSVFPVLFMFSNGLILGVVSYSVVTDYSLPFLLVGIVPHGVLELPAAIVGAGIGLMLGDKVMGNFFRGEKNEIRKETKKAILFIIKFLVPIILIAAFIEIFVTSRLM